MKKVTIIGASGLVGMELVKQLNDKRIEVYAPTRSDRDHVLSVEHDHVIYCAGENQTDLEHLENIIDIQASYLGSLIKRGNFKHLTYFSSTRLYGSSSNTNENANIEFSLKDPRALFNSSKLFAETICNLKKENVLILRPSNIYGLTTTSKLFLPSITRDAVTKKVINMYVPKDYSKDYIDVRDVARVCILLAEQRQTGTFNVASGINVRADGISSILSEQTSCEIIWHPVGNQDIFAPIKIDKLKEFYPTFEPLLLRNSLQDLIKEFKGAYKV